jgi:hypothetical protein
MKIFFIYKNSFWGYLFGTFNNSCRSKIIIKFWICLYIFLGKNNLVLEGFYRNFLTRKYEIRITKAEKSIKYFSPRIPLLSKNA